MDRTRLPSRFDSSQPRAVETRPEANPREPRRRLTRVALLSWVSIGPAETRRTEETGTTRHRRSRQGRSHTGLVPQLRAKLQSTGHRHFIDQSVHRFGKQKLSSIHIDQLKRFHSVRRDRNRLAADARPVAFQILRPREALILAAVFHPFPKRLQMTARHDQSDVGELGTAFTRHYPREQPVRFDKPSRHTHVAREECLMPDDFTGLVGTGKVCRNAGDLTGAEEYFWRAIQTNPCVSDPIWTWPGCFIRSRNRARSRWRWPN
jgi:hypothetical protein